MRLSSYSLALLAGLLALSCNREDAREPSLSPAEEECVVHFTLKGEDGTKSILPADIENRLDNAFVLMTSEDGYFRYQYLDLRQNPQGKSVEWRMPAGRDYTLYAVGNMGDILSRIPRTETGFDMAQFRYEVPPYAQMTALPMAACRTVSAQQVAQGSQVEIPISLQRLMAKVCVKIDKSRITGGAVAQALQSGALHLRQVARALYPFRAQGSRALGNADVFPGNTDYYIFSAAEAWNLDSGEITLYLPENRQGTGTGTSQAEKKPATGREGLVTYLEYTADKNGAQDGLSGDMTYRVYLGENETNNFDVVRGHVYNATLNLSWNGLFYEGDWRVTTASDSRALVISEAANSSTPMMTENTKAGSAKVRKGTPTAFYMNFFPNGTSGSVAHSRKDQSSWPYGWVAYVDGSSVYMSGTSGIIKTPSNENLISWSYNTTTDCLSMETIPGAPASTVIHTLQFKTVDGRKESNMVYFTTSIPFEFRWRESGNPNHVAQRGILEALDADTHAVDAQGVFHVKDGYSSKVRLTDNSDGTAVVELIDGFTAIEDAVYIEDADGDRHCDVPLEARIPYWECTSLGTTFVDKPQTLVFSYFPVDENGNKVGSTPMQIKESTGVTTGMNLCFALTEECIVPTTTSSGGKLGFDRKINTDSDSPNYGKYELFTYIATYAGLSPTDDTFVVDNAVVGMTKSSKGSQQSAFTAYNPWKFVSNTVVPGPLMNDYTLYRAPARSGPASCRVGWNTNPSDAPAETTSKTVQVRNVVISSPRNLKLDAKFQDGSGYIGEKIATGTPGTVSPTYTETTLYQLHVRLTDAVNFDWVALGNYLYYDLAHYIPGSVWLNPTATDAIKKGEITSLFDECRNDVAISSYGMEAEVWAQAASGVTKSNPTALQGIEFFTTSQTIGSNWDLTYSMNGLTSDDITTHGAGKLDVILKIVNPYDKTGVTLDKKVSEAFMRLHLWVWASVTEVTQIHPSYSSGSSQGWAYKVTPYVFTDGKPISAISGLFSKNIFKPQGETYTTASTTYLRGYAANLSMGGDYYGNKGEATWQFRNDNIFQTDWSDAKKRSELMKVLSASTGNSIFEFRMPVNQSVTWPDFYGPSQSYTETIEGLNSILGGDDYCYRQSATRLYYDPSGPAHTYVSGSTSQGQNKLFVIYIGETSLAINPYFFDPARGYVNP